MVGELRSLLGDAYSGESGRKCGGVMTGELNLPVAPPSGASNFKFGTASSGQLEYSGICNSKISGFDDPKTTECPASTVSGAGELKCPNAGVPEV